MKYTRGRYLPGERGLDHPLAFLIDRDEGPGRHIIEEFVHALPPLATAVDVGAGGGLDLAAVKKAHPGCRTMAIEAGGEYLVNLEGKADDIQILNIERDEFPFAPESIDLFIANQVLEHTKEVFWIFDQVFHALKVGGHFIVGVPNVLSLHNRLLGLLGVHPTQHKLCSAHVRPFSKKDTALFLSACFPGCSIVRFAGSQFYPFPSYIARPLCRVFPSAAFSIFFLIRKDAAYHGEFAAYPARANLETNFWYGGRQSGQYW